MTREKKVKIGLVGILFGILLCAFFVSGRIRAKQEQELSVMHKQLEELEEQLQAQTQVNRSTDAQVSYSLTGLDPIKVESDTRTVIQFFNDVLVWNNYKEYCAARQLCMTEYGLLPDSRFLIDFMPNVLEAVAPDGSRYNTIDQNGINVHFEELKPYVTQVSEDGYTYVGVVTWSSRKDGNVGLSKLMTTYTVNNEGKIVNMDAYTLVE